MTDAGTAEIVVVDAAPDERARTAGDIVGRQLGLAVTTLPAPIDAGQEAALIRRVESAATALAVMALPASAEQALPARLDALLQVHAPLLVLGRACPGVPDRGLRRMLVPIDGAPATGAAAAAARSLFAGRGTDTVVVHVLVRDTVPPHLDQPQHGYAELASRLLATATDRPTGTFRLAHGEVAQQILDSARDERADLVVVAWSRDLSPGRAKVFRALVATSPIPLLCVPVASAAVSPARRAATVRG